MEAENSGYTTLVRWGVLPKNLLYILTVTLILTNMDASKFTMKLQKHLTEDLALSVKI